MLYILLILSPLLDNADAFVLPCIVAINGDMDGLLNVIVDAMLIVTNIFTPISDILDILENKITRLFVDVSDERAIANISFFIIKLNKKLARSIKRSAKEKIKKNQLRNVQKG